MQQHKPPVETSAAPGAGWYRQPVLWLGLAILVASLAGCVWMIVLGQRYADIPLEGVHPHTLLDMPMHEGHAGGAAHAERPHAVDTDLGKARRKP